jgi:DNA-directed RNA polymerase subunit RPC12/RpoP
LTKIRGSGEFRCPRCGTEMSPDDDPEDVYAILETIRKEDRLERIILQCNKCGSQVHLIGFDILKENDENSRHVIYCLSILEWF